MMHSRAPGRSSSRASWCVVLETVAVVVIECDTAANLHVGSAQSGSSSIRGHVTYSRGTDAQSLDDSMVLVYPIGPTRPAYVHKQGAAPSSGRIVWRRPNTKPVTLDFTDGLTNLGASAKQPWSLTHSHSLTEIGA